MQVQKINKLLIFKNNYQNLQREYKFEIFGLVQYLNDKIFKTRGRVTHLNSIALRFDDKFATFKRRNARMKRYYL